MGHFLRRYVMPIATINIIEGRSDEKKEALIEKVSLAIAESLDAPIESVRVIINEMPKQHFGIGGKSAKKLGK
jgi:4-oxalocrotonate tautomerase